MVTDKKWLNDSYLLTHFLSSPFLEILSHLERTFYSCYQNLKKNVLKVNPIYLFITHINDDKIATMLNTVKCGQAAPMYDTSVRLYMYTVHCTSDLYCAT